MAFHRWAQSSADMVRRKVSDKNVKMSKCHFWRKPFQSCPSTLSKDGNSFAFLERNVIYTRICIIVGFNRVLDCQNKFIVGASLFWGFIFMWVGCTVLSVYIIDYHALPIIFSHQGWHCPLSVVNETLFCCKEIYNSAKRYLYRMQNYEIKNNITHNGEVDFQVPVVSMNGSVAKFFENAKFVSIATVTFSPVGSYSKNKLFANWGNIILRDAPESTSS